MKVADLGEARRISALAQYEKPPSPARNWIPPEIVPKHSPPSNYTLKSEVYAVCIVIAEVSGKPFLSLFDFGSIGLFSFNLIDAMLISAARLAGITFRRTSRTSNSSHMAR